MNALFHDDADDKDMKENRKINGNTQKQERVQH